MQFAGFRNSAAFLAFALVGVPPLSSVAELSVFPSQSGYEQDIRPLLSKYCYDCHGEKRQRADLSLEAYQSIESIREEHALWTEVLRKIQTGEMPPEGKPQPTNDERDQLTAWINAELFPVDCDNPDPGRVTIRRLNRAEYNNTIRDLLGIDFHAAAALPADDTGYGFDNIGDVLSLSPLLLEKYLAAAEAALDLAIIEGDGNRALPESHKRIFFCHSTHDQSSDCARAILQSFARRAFRRPATPAELDRLTSFARQSMDNGVTFERGIKLALHAVLVSPHFLFRGEIQANPNDPGEIVPVDEFALASRLSYFLWSSMPDDELLTMAEKGQLRKNLEAQVRRMVQDPKSNAFVENFSGQWLQTRMLKETAPDPQLFPAFDQELRAAMARETLLFFETLFREDLPITEFLTADFSFVNQRLARHYGLKGISGDDFQRVSLKGTGRVGILTHGSVLALSSNPTRTSPVKRGKWVLETLLAQAPPPPPPGVPPLEESKEDQAIASLRERTERHRADPVCASCHSVMDPIGFSLEHFDAIGAWRDKDGAFDVDASGKLPGGETFDGAEGLSALLASQRKEQFARCVAEKMLTYALGRGLEYYDRCALDRITGELAKHDYRFSVLVMGVVNSVPFQMRRGEGVAQ